MSGAAGSDVIPAAILDEAAAWLVRLHGDGDSEATRQACAQWRQRSPQHDQAWARAERLLQRLGSLPPELAMPALGRERVGRRRALKHLALLLAVAPAALTTWHAAPWEVWLADQRTAVGEVRALALPDGSQLTLNTDSALDLRFDGQRRHLQLRQGELLLHAAADPRPLLLDVAVGRLSTPGARFSLREQGDAARLVVLEGAVRVQPLDGLAQWVPAGRQGRFDRQRLGPLAAAEASAVAWTHGMLMADRLPLAELLAELARYHHGVLRCAPAVAGLAVSGAYPLRDRGRALAMLAATYPVRVRRLTDLWISLDAA